MPSWIERGRHVLMHEKRYRSIDAVPVQLEHDEHSNRVRVSISRTGRHDGSGTGNSLRPGWRASARNNKGFYGTRLGVLVSILESNARRKMGLFCNGRIERRGPKLPARPYSTVASAGFHRP